MRLMAECLQGGEQAPLPYWLVNVPESERPMKCPDYLRVLTDKDRSIIATRDADFHTLSWNEVKDLVARKDFVAFKRRPTQLRIYRWFTYKIKREYGSVMNYVLKERLKWHDLTPKFARPLKCKDDYSILYNDCPYGIDERIYHLVVWTKLSFPCDHENGELTPEGLKHIEDFVRTTFIANAQDADRVIWFKNPPALRSVHALDHFHVMLFEPDKAFLDEVTDGDVAKPIEPGEGYANGFE